MLVPCFISILASIKATQRSCREEWQEKSFEKYFRNGKVLIEEFIKNGRKRTKHIFNEAIKKVNMVPGSTGYLNTPSKLSYSPAGRCGAEMLKKKI